MRQWNRCGVASYGKCETHTADVERRQVPRTHACVAPLTRRRSNVVFDYGKRSGTGTLISAVSELGTCVAVQSVSDRQVQAPMLHVPPGTDVGVCFAEHSAPLAFLRWSE